MNEYYIADSNLLYEHINNGITNFDINQYATDDNVLAVFNRLSKDFCPVIFRSRGIFTKDGKKIELKMRALGVTTMAKFSMPENLEVVNPMDLGIIHKYANMVYDIYKCSLDSITERMQKVAQDLAINNEDLANYLSLTIKLATNNEIKNSKISYKYVENKLRKEDSNKLKLFAEIYNKEYNRAIEYKLPNAKNAALFSAITKAGVKFE